MKDSQMIRLCLSIKNFVNLFPINRGIIHSVPFENNAICAKLSLSTIFLESEATEDPGESLENKSLN